MYLLLSSSSCLEYCYVFNYDWQLRVLWKNCIHQILLMNFRSSHIFREGNQIADALVCFGLSYSGMTWWDSPLSLLILTFIYRDIMGLPNFRFCWSVVLSCFDDVFVWEVLVYVSLSHFFFFFSIELTSFFRGSTKKKQLTWLVINLVYITTLRIWQYNMLNYLIT